MCDGGCPLPVPIALIRTAFSALPCSDAYGVVTFDEYLLAVVLYSF